MKKDNATKVESKKKLVLRRATIRTLDKVDLSPVNGGGLEDDEGSRISCSCPPYDVM